MLAAETEALKTAARYAAEIQKETNAERMRFLVQLRNVWLEKAEKLAAAERGATKRPLA